MGRVVSDSTLSGLLALCCAAVFVFGVLPTGTPSPFGTAAAAVCLSIAVLAPLLGSVLTRGLEPLLQTRYLPGLGIVYWVLLDMVQQLYELPLDAATVRLGYLAVALFAAGCLLGARGQVHRYKWTGWLDRIHLTSGAVFLAAVVCFVLSVSYYLFRCDWDVSTLLDAMTVGRGRTPWSRGSYGDEWAALEFLIYFGYLLPTLLVLQIRTSRDKVSPQIVITAAMSIFVSALVLTEGARRSIGVMVLSAILSWIMTGSLNRIRRKVSLSHFIFGFVTVAGVAVGLNLVLATRGDWTRRVNLDEDTYNAVRVDDNFLRICQTIDAVPGYAPYAGFQPLIFAAVRPIPRVLWPGKPSGPGFTIHEFLGFRDTSLSSSVIGELYASFGFLAVFLGGLVYGRLCRWWSGVISSGHSLVRTALYCSGYFTLFAGMRAMVDLFLFSYPVLAGLLLLMPFAALGTSAWTLRSCFRGRSGVLPKAI